MQVRTPRLEPNLAIVQGTIGSDLERGTMLACCSLFLMYAVVDVVRRMDNRKRKKAERRGKSRKGRRQ